MTTEDILAEHPDLEPADIAAALNYAAEALAEHHFELATGKQVVPGQGFRCVVFPVSVVEHTVLIDDLARASAWYLERPTK